MVSTRRGRLQKFVSKDRGLWRSTSTPLPGLPVSCRRPCSCRGPPRAAPPRPCPAAYLGSRPSTCAWCSPSCLGSTGGCPGADSAQTKPLFIYSAQTCSIQRVKKTDIDIEVSIWKQTWWTTADETSAKRGLDMACHSSIFPISICQNCRHHTSYRMACLQGPADTNRKGTNSYRTEIIS